MPFFLILKRRRSAVLAALAILAGGAIPARAAATYYFAASGEDASDCRTATAPCRSLERLNSLPQLAGASFLLRRGDRFPGEILVQGSGSPDAPVTFAAYGDGPPPVIDGGLPVSAWTLAGQGPSAWTFSADVPPEADGQPFALIMDGRTLPLARFPDSGFLPLQSGDSVSAQLSPSDYAGHLGDLAGAGMWIRSQRRILSSRAVKGFDPLTGLLEWDSPLPKGPAAGSGVFFSDAVAELDRPGEWFCHPAGARLPADGRRLRLALSPDDSPAAHSLRIANAGYGIKASGVSHVRISGLAFEAQVSAALYLYDCANVEVSDCRIRAAVLTGIDFRGSGLTATGNVIEGAALAGISSGPDPDLNPLQSGETAARIQGNRISRIGLFPDMGRPGPDEDGETGIGIRVLGEGDMIAENRIDSTASDGIKALGRRTVVEGNAVRKACLHLDEAAAIHVGPASGPWGSEGMLLRHNLILSVPGSAAGAPGSATRGYGIFLDERTAEAKVEGNFIADADVGVCVRRGRGHAVAGNVLYANRLAPFRDGIAGAGAGTGAGAGGNAANLFRGNAFWSVWGKGPGFLPAPAAESLCGTGGNATPCAGAARAANLSCAESDGSPACAGDPATLYPGTGAAQLGVRFRDFAMRWETGDPLPGAWSPALKALLPLPLPEPSAPRR
jgi:hypothetical protein